VATELEGFIASISDAYDRLGHRLGWRFLYSPAKTLAPGTRLAFVGLNPGGRTYYPPMPSVEAGNAYRVERWGAGETLNPLQEQIALLYEEIARRCPGSSPVRLMDETLAVNFCPFRSPTWEMLARRVESVAFSRELWQRVLQVVEPRAIVCLGEMAMRHLGEVLVAHGARRAAPLELRPTGWGSVRYTLAAYESPSGRTMLIRLPHLSRFRIFGRAGSAQAADELASAIAAHAYGSAA
jgi:hypothetical protein